MLAPALHPQEDKRIEVLHSCRLLDTPEEPIFDALVNTASQVVETEIALLSLVDKKRQWFKARKGLRLKQGPRSTSFCGHTILEDTPLIIEDTLQDERFSDNPLVQKNPNIRAYLGIPIKIDDMPIGTLCLISKKPKVFKPKEVNIVKSLACLASHQISERKNKAILMHFKHTLSNFSSFLNRRDYFYFYSGLTPNKKKKKLPFTKAIESKLHNQYVQHRLMHKGKSFWLHPRDLISLESLSASLNHEINNPLTITIGAIKAIKRKLAQMDEGPDIDAIEENLQFIEDSSYRVRDVMRELRNLADTPIVEGKAKSLSEVFTEVVEYIEKEYKYLRFEMDLPKKSRTVAPKRVALLFYTLTTGLILKSMEELESNNTQVSPIALKVTEDGGKCKISLSVSKEAFLPGFQWYGDYEEEILETLVKDLRGTIIFREYPSVFFMTLSLPL